VLYSGFVEAAHLGMEASRKTNERQSEGGAAGFAQTKTQVEQWLQPELC
jgi:hypothetical protein